METSPWMLIPFAVMLLVIAVGPLVAPVRWESKRFQLLVTLLIALPAGGMLVSRDMGDELLHQIFHDYVPFIVLLTSLYIVTSSIRIKGDLRATPWMNSAFLLQGYVLASLMGTTGAAMLLIRPLLDTNRQRTHKAHTVLFFIAMVANCGGVLSPLGDPPLFLLYLRGAPFFWFLQMFPAWLFVGGVLLGVYLLLDLWFYYHEPAEAIQKDNLHYLPLRIKGRINFFYLLLIILSVVFLNVKFIPAMASGPLMWLREDALCVISALSLLTTRKRIRRSNGFSWDPILEVAILFLGIFVTMTPAMDFLHGHAASLGMTRPWQFYYLTGSLSSFLDNSPTAVAFHSVASGLPLLEGSLPVAGVSESILEAIAMSAVFFGSMTYIGNGPNFMVKAIAEHSGVKMPTFFGYILRFALPLLLPVFILTQWLFL